MGQNFAFIQVERCKQWLFKVGDWCFILAPERAYEPLGTFWTTWSYSHVVRWPELTVGCEVNNHSPSPVQGERGWVHCVHKNWSPVKCKTSSRRFVEYFQGWKKSFYLHTLEPMVCGWLSQICFCWLLEVHLLHSCFVSSGPQSLAAKKSSWWGFNNWGWCQIVQQH